MAKHFWNQEDAKKIAVYAITLLMTRMGARDAYASKKVRFYVKLC